MNSQSRLMSWLTWSLAVIFAFAALPFSAVCVAADKTNSFVQAGTKPKKEKKKEEFAVQIQQLQAIREQVHSAIHDYKGHRGAAMKHLGKAIHALSPSASTKLGPSTTPGETQLQSDAKLQQALASLTVLQKELAANKGKRAVNATVAVNAAIKELTVALSVK